MHACVLVCVCACVDIAYLIQHASCMSYMSYIQGLFSPCSGVGVAFGVIVVLAIALLLVLSILWSASHFSLTQLELAMSCPLHHSCMVNTPLCVSLYSFLSFYAIPTSLPFAIYYFFLFRLSVILCACFAYLFKCHRYRRRSKPLQSYKPTAEMQNISTGSAPKHDATKTVSALHEPVEGKSVQPSPEGQASIRASPEPGLQNVMVILRTA